jgi:prolyl-tRNA synthetase
VHAGGRGRIWMEIKGGDKGRGSADAPLRVIVRAWQADMLAKARHERDSHISIVHAWADFIPSLDLGNMVLSPWCQRIACEEEVKERTGPKAAAAAAAAAPTEAEAVEASKGLTGAAKTLCIPFEQPPIPEATPCFCCGQPAQTWVMWGRSY